MIYSVDIEIDLPRDKVLELLDNAENLFKWQRGLQKFEHLSGEPGQVGAKSKMTFLMGAKEVVLVETITKRQLPTQLDATFETKGVFNTVKNRFEQVDGVKTKWISDNEFQFTGFMKVMAFLMKSAFGKQTLAYMQDFKAFAENGTDVRDAE